MSYRNSTMKVTNEALDWNSALIRTIVDNLNELNVPNTRISYAIDDENANSYGIIIIRYWSINISILLTTDSVTYVINDKIRRTRIEEGYDLGDPRSIERAFELVRNFTEAL